VEELMGAGVPSLPSPLFVPDADGLDPNAIVADMISVFETATNRTLYPAEVERLLIDLYAYREALIRNAIQYAGEQNLVAFAAFPMLDYLGQLVGVTRLAAQPAGCTLQFTLANALTIPFVVPKGTRVGTQDGQYIFATLADLTIPAGATSGTVSALATVAGPGGNGYVAGQVSVQITPNSLISAVANTDTSADGSDPETDDHLRQRIQLAPNGFSKAGPADAYRLLALGVSAAIVDAQVVSPVPGTVQVFILTGPITTQPVASPNSAGIAGSTLIAQVLAALSGDTVRPLDDTVEVDAVTEVDYTITATITTYSDVDGASILSQAQATAAQFAIENAARIQRDIVPSQWIAALSLPGVYEVTVAIAANIGGTPVAPQSDGRVLLAAGQWSNCTAITITQATGSEHS
jgi:phage-related baseplate assembly protein